MDTPSLLLSRFAVSAGVFYTARIRGVHAFAHDTQRALPDESSSHLH